MDSTSQTVAVWKGILEAPAMTDSSVDPGSQPSGPLTPVLEILMDDPEQCNFVYNTQGQFIFVSRAFCRWLGKTPAELLHHRAEDCWPAEQAEQDHEDLRTLQPGDRVEREAERTSRAGPRRVHLSKVALHDATGSRAGLLVRLRDRTEEEEQSYLRARTQRIETLGRLTGGVIHDFNNLLTVFHGYLDQLRQDVLPSRQSALQAMARAVDHGQDLTRQLLAYVRSDPQTFKPLDLNGLISNLTSMLGPTLGRHIRLELALGTNIPAVLGDVSQLTQVVVNLCLNARDAMPNGGSLRLETDEVKMEAGNGVNGLPGPYIRLRVTDTGEGIPPEIQARMYEPLFTTKKAGEGTGLGLALVSDLVRRHRGIIRCDSEVGRGTCFTILIPALPQPSPAGVAVLVLNDAPEIRQLIRLILEQQQYQVFLAEDEKQAAEISARVSVDVILLESSEGQGDVLALAAQLAPQASVLIISDLPMMLPPGPSYAIVRKPFHAAQLIGSVQRLLEERKAR